MSEDSGRDPGTESIDPAGRADERPVSTEPVAADRAATHTDVAADPEQQIDRDPSSERAAPAGAAGGAAGSSAHDGLLADGDRTGYQSRWDDIQVQFIDEPRQSVRQADDLVGEVTREIAERFTGFRRDFEQRWDSGNEPTTEELRLALQRYRDFFQRLVAR